MPVELDAALAQLPGAIEVILRNHPDGISEFELIRSLRQADHLPPQASSAGHPLQLFQLHFLVFHCLYRLRDFCWQTQTGLLEINPLNIRLYPYMKGQAAIGEVDPLRDYYLDLNNLSTTDEVEVIAMLSHFWIRMNGQDERQAALKTLGLDLQAGVEEIKIRYRKLVMQHHPDRGGDKATLQALNEAMAWLEKYHQYDK